MRRIGFLQQRQRLTPATRLDTEEVHPYTKLLRLLHADSKILVSRKENCV